MVFHLPCTRTSGSHPNPNPLEFKYVIHKCSPHNHFQKKKTRRTFQIQTAGLQAIQQMPKEQPKTKNKKHPADAGKGEKKQNYLKISSAEARLQLAQLQPPGTTGDRHECACASDVGCPISDPPLKVTNFEWVKWKPPLNTKRLKSYGTGWLGATR